MKKLIAGAFFVSVALAGISGVQAMPLAPLTTDSLVTTVAGGCGPGFHRGPMGRCRPNAGPMPRACPRGYHMGPYGRCRPNY